MFAGRSLQALPGVPSVTLRAAAGDPLYARLVKVSRRPSGSAVAPSASSWLERASALARQVAAYPYALGEGALGEGALGEGTLGGRTPGGRTPGTGTSNTRTSGEGPGGAGTSGAGPTRIPVSAFSRLAAVHSLSAAGDAMVAVALAGSVFFDVSATAAQSKVALSLALTVAPFAVVGPLLGPVLERARGGRRAIVMASAFGRALCCFFMAFWAHSVVLFPIAFFSLVFSKLYLVSKAALVPGAVERPEQLVVANSKLSVGGSAVGTLAGCVGAGVLEAVGAPVLLRLDIFVYLACCWAAAKLRPARLGSVAVPRAHKQPRVHVRVDGHEAHPPLLALPPGGIQLAALTTGGLRAATGFVTFLLVFTFRRGSAALIWYGLALGAAQLGNVAAGLVSPRLRQKGQEEWMLTAASVVIGTMCVVAGVISWGGHWAVAVLLSGCVGLTAGSGKLAFDSMVQRDVPSRVRARSFARYESAFQLVWALGGLIAVVFRIPLAQGFVGTGLVALAGALAFARGSVLARRGALPAWWPGSAPRPTG